MSKRSSSSKGSRERAPGSSELTTTGALIVALIASCANAPNPAPQNRDAPALNAVSSSLSIDGPSVKLAPVVGQLAQPAPGQSEIGFYGADLGWSFQHGDELRVLFGDSWQSASGAMIGRSQDDAEGWISLRDFPDGDAVERHAYAHEAVAPYLGAAPELRMRVDAAGRVAPIAVFRHDLDGPELPMSILQVPIAGFSNGQDAFAIFHRSAPLACSGADEQACPARFRCDHGLGLCAGAEPGTFQRACVLGAAECDCRPVLGGGLCQDAGSSQYRADLDVGRIWSVVLTQEIGVAVAPTVYVTRAWPTNRFVNAVAKSVRAFDPEHASRPDDFRPVSEPARDAKVLLWGRPNFVGIADAGLDAALYFAYAEMPRRDREGNFAWAPRYFKGMRDGVPQFSEEPTDAAPLELAGGTGLTREPHDFVNQMGISYVEPLRRWVMFYGGGAPSAVDFSVALPDGTRPVHDTRNAILARVAEQPYGPWSAPFEVLSAGNPLDAPLTPGSEFGPGGMLHHDACRVAGCAPGEPNPLYSQTPWGFFYAPLIVDAWTEPRAQNAADVYWFLSTWSPYQVVLMKTRLRV